jgi:hypothetical protein
MQCFFVVILVMLATKVSGLASLAFLAAVPLALLWIRLVLWVLVGPRHWIDVEDSGFTLGDSLGRVKFVEWKDVRGVKVSNSRAHPLAVTWPFVAPPQTAEILLSTPMFLPGHWFLVPYRSLRLSTDDASAVALSVDQRLGSVGATAIGDP